MKPINFLLPIILIFLLFGCNKEANEKIYTISGTVQKGPFINGSEIIVYELNSFFTPTGRSFHGTITNLGKFEVTSVPLVSSYVELVASGFYFNEVTGELSSAPITLSAIVDLNENEKVNVNILTNLEYRRIKYLMQNKNRSFNAAKELANSEIMNLFAFDNGSVTHPELLDISQQGDDNAILLAISAILQGNFSTAEMSKNMSDIITDMEQDGTLDDAVLRNSIYTQAWLLNVDQIRENVIANYESFGIDLVAVNNFDEKIDFFIKNAGDEFQSPFDFPESTEWGPNILVGDSVVLQTQTNYSIAVNMPSTGVLAIKLKIIKGNGSFYYRPLHTVGFTSNHFNDVERYQIYTSTANGQLIYIPMLFEGYGVASVQIFFNDMEVSSLERTITWGGYNDSDIYFQEMNPYGKNILALPDKSELVNDSVYCVSISGDNFDVKFELFLPAGVSVEVTGGWDDYSYEILEDRLKFNLKGNSITDIMFKFQGEGTVQLTSDLKFHDGTFLSRTYYLKKK